MLSVNPVMPFGYPLKELPSGDWDLLKVKVSHRCNSWRKAIYRMSAMDLKSDLSMLLDLPRSMHLLQNLNTFL